MERNKAIEDLRNSLQDVLSVLSGLHGTCETLEEALGIVELATINDGQLRLLMEQCKRVAKEREAPTAPVRRGVVG